MPECGDRFYRSSFASMSFEFLYADVGHAVVCVVLVSCSLMSSVGVGSSAPVSCEVLARFVVLS